MPETCQSGSIKATMFGTIHGETVVIEVDEKTYDRFRLVRGKRKGRLLTQNEVIRRATINGGLPLTETAIQRVLGELEKG